MASLYQVTALEYKFQPIFNPYNQHYKTGKYENAYTGVYKCTTPCTLRPSHVVLNLSLMFCFN